MNILLVRLRLIGDVVFTTPIVRALRRHQPGARLTYLVEPAAEPVLALVQQGGKDRIALSLNDAMITTSDGTTM